MRSAIALITASLLGACASSPPAIFVPSAPSQSATTPANPPPQRPATSQNPPKAASFIAPEVMSLPGLERIIGQNAETLEKNLGKARLNVKEGDARKMQFASDNCVLDVYLYPMQPGETPSATHVQARRSADGSEVDRVACLRSIEGN